MSTSDSTRASELIWRPLSRADIARLPEIDRSEVSGQRYDVRDGELVLVNEHVERTRWTPAYFDVRLPRLYASFDHEGCGWSVFLDDRLAAISVIDGRRMGADLEMLDLTFIHVTRELRGTGVGSELFDRSIAAVRERGAKRMYISASDSRATVDFYVRRGMRLAAPPDPRLHEIGPSDIHLELDL